MSGRRRYVHVFSTFGRGGPQIRAVQLMQRLGGDVEHVVMAMDGDTGARQQLPADVAVTFCDPPVRGGFAATARRQRAWLQQQRPDLVLTYNWGAIETVAAARKLRLPRVHHEDGFAPDEANRVLRRRNWLRWWLLRGAPLVVPSRLLVQHARRHWGLDALHLVNGVDLHRFRPSPTSPPDFVVGSVGGLRAEKDYRTLLAAVARMRQPARVCLVGNGPLEAALRAQVQQLGVQERVEFVGHTDDTAAWYPRFSVFVLSSITEQMPIALLEAMASGLPCVATDVGDVRSILPASAERFVVPASAPDALAAQLDALAADEALRRAQGEANRARATDFEAGACLRRFVEVYRSTTVAG